MAYRETITRSHHVVCEGPDDIALFCRLIRDRGIPDLEAGCGRNVTIDDARCLGTSGFSQRVIALKSLVPPTPVTRGIIIATDADGNSNHAFGIASAALTDAGLPTPSRPLEIMNPAGLIKTAIIVLPIGEPEGGLESLLLECIGYAGHSKNNCVETFHRCSYPNGIQTKQLHKVQLRTLIAALYPDDPSMGLSFFLSNRNRPFPMTHPALDPIADFLARFVAA